MGHSNARRAGHTTSTSPVQHHDEDGDAGSSRSLPALYSHCYSSQHRWARMCWPDTSGYLSLETQSSGTCALGDGAVKETYIRPHTGEYVAPNEDEWSWERVEGMVNGTRGFYARDWPLQLGWNNVCITLLVSSILLVLYRKLLSWGLSRRPSRKGDALACFCTGTRFRGHFDACKHSHMSHLSKLCLLPTCPPPSSLDCQLLADMT